jgi:predicted SAM-dependent methyltransferase
MPDHQVRLLNYVQAGGTIDFRQHDATLPFTQHPDNSIGGIYVGQFIEHLSYSQARKFLQECRRMLRPGFPIRMTTPDLSKIIDAYLHNDMDRYIDDQPDFYKQMDQSAKFSSLIFGSAGPDSSQTNYEGHQFCYTETSMRQLLESLEFKNITFDPKTETLKNTVGMPCDEFSGVINNAGMSHSLYVEATK